jgi:predicted component of type VI protein secretion system
VRLEHLLSREKIALVGLKVKALSLTLAVNSNNTRRRELISIEFLELRNEKASQPSQYSCLITHYYNKQSRSSAG